MSDYSYGRVVKGSRLHGIRPYSTSRLVAVAYCHLSLYSFNVVSRNYRADIFYCRTKNGVRVSRADSNNDDRRPMNEITSSWNKSSVERNVPRGPGRMLSLSTFSHRKFGLTVFWEQSSSWPLLREANEVTQSSEPAMTTARINRKV